MPRVFTLIVNVLYCSLLFNASQNHYSYCHLTIQSFKTYSTHYHCDGGPLCVARRIWLFNGILPKQYQFDDTENNKMIIKMFEINWLLACFIFRYCDYYTFVEELLFETFVNS